MKPVLDFAAATFREHYRDVRGVSAPAARLAAARQHVAQKLADPEAFHRFSILNGRVLSFLQAWKLPDGRVFIYPWLPASDKDAASELAALRAHFGTKPQLNVTLFPAQTNLRKSLERRGFELDSFTLTGRVADGLTTTRRRLKTLDRSGYDLAPMDFYRDLNAVLRLDRLCHDAEPTSRAHAVSPAAHRREMRSYLAKHMKPPSRALVLRFGRSIVGFIADTIPPKRNQDALLGSISIHPDHQGKGLAAWLYHEALSNMSAAGITWYVGYSSTDKVLHLAQSMKRRISDVTLREPR